MHSPSALEFTPTEEPPRQDGVDDPQPHPDGPGGTGPHQGRRFSRGAWPRHAGRRSRRAQAAHCERRLSAGEERTLAARARAGDADAQQELITANLALVLHAARDYKHRGVPLDDLIQEGNLGRRARPGTLIRRPTRLGSQPTPITGSAASSCGPSAPTVWSSRAKETPVICAFNIARPSPNWSLATRRPAPSPTRTRRVSTRSPNTLGSRHAARGGMARTPRSSRSPELGRTYAY